MTVRILYHQEPHGWWAESADIDGRSVARESYDEVRRLAEHGVSFASVAEERARCLEEEWFASVSVEHYVSVPP